MKKSDRLLEFSFERSIPALPAETFDAWLDPQVSGTIWNAAEKFVIDKKTDGLFYWELKGTSHYGRFTEFQRPNRIKHTWMSPNTLGQESTVTVTFEKVNATTRMTLIHSGLPDCEPARGHENGWNYFLQIFLDQFGGGTRKKFQFDEAHPGNC